MSGMGQALSKADELLGELAAPPAREQAPTMGRLAKISYTHDAMIDLLIEASARPGGISQKELAARFGYTESWISNIFASDAFQVRLAVRREQIIDPTLRATVREKFEALARLSIDVLQKKLEKTDVSDQVALRCAELGAKALGVGVQAPAAPSLGVDRLEVLANRLLALQSSVKERVINGEAQVLSTEPAQEQK